MYVRRGINVEVRIVHYAVLRREKPRHKSQHRALEHHGMSRERWERTLWQWFGIEWGARCLSRLCPRPFEYTPGYLCCIPRQYKIEGIGGGPWGPEQRPHLFFLAAWVCESCCSFGCFQASGLTSFSSGTRQCAYASFAPTAESWQPQSPRNVPHNAHTICYL